MEVGVSKNNEFVWIKYILFIFTIILGCLEKKQNDLLAVCVIKLAKRAMKRWNVRFFMKKNITIPTNLEACKWNPLFFKPKDPILTIYINNYTFMAHTFKAKKNKRMINSYEVRLAFKVLKRSIGTKNRRVIPLYFPKSNKLRYK